MNVYVRHYHKIGQNPLRDTELCEYTGAWNLDSIWRWLKRNKLVMESKSRRAVPRHEDETAVFFLSGTYHSVVIGPVDGPSAARHNGKAGKTS